MAAQICFAVLSDLHVEPIAETGNVSNFLVGAPEMPHTHPFVALRKLIEDQKLTADYVVCPGDIGNKASTIGISTGWKSLHELKSCLSAAEVLAVSGNHDLDSRLQANKYDPRGFLMSLKPRFPLSDVAACDKYWARHYSILDFDPLRVVLLNSCAYHYGDKNPEIGRGRISEWALKSLEEDLQSLTPKPLQVLICHHHPLKHPEIEYEENQIMIGGDGLLNLLDSGNFGEWMIIHGHKHYPRLSYGPGSSHPPIVFAAGSFSGPLYDLGANTRNNFYIITLNVPTTGGSITGNGKAWEWATGAGWVEATRKSSGIPHRFSFGTRTNLPALAGKIATMRGVEYLNWSELTAQVPDAKYLSPFDIAKVHNLLKTHNKAIIYAETGEPLQVGPFDV